MERHSRFEEWVQSTCTIFVFSMYFNLSIYEVPLTRARVTDSRFSSPDLLIRRKNARNPVLFARVQRDSILLNRERLVAARSCSFSSSSDRRENSTLSRFSANAADRERLSSVADQLRVALHTDPHCTHFVKHVPYCFARQVCGKCHHSPGRCAILEDQRPERRFLRQGIYACILMQCRGAGPLCAVPTVEGE